MNVRSGLRRLTFVIWLAVAVLLGGGFVLDAKLYENPLEEVCWESAVYESGKRKQLRFCQSRFQTDRYQEELATLAIYEVGWGLLVVLIYCGVAWIVAGFREP